MPIQIGKDKDGCFSRWGDKGAKYHFECGNEEAKKEAKAKSLAQAVAIGEFAKEKISFDYDETLTKKDITDKAKEYVKNGADVYIISARHNATPMYSRADEIGIPHSRIYATGSNKAKIEKIKELGISKHYDNNSDVIKELGSIGTLVKLNIHERFAALINFMYNDNSTIK